MRVLPFLSSELDPTPWKPFGDVELYLEDFLHPAWLRPNAPAVHALHLPPAAWGEALVKRALEALRIPLGFDFLVLCAAPLIDRADQSNLLKGLEILLEASRGRGPRIVLRPTQGAAPALAQLLRDVRGEAVGFCWDPAVGMDLDAIHDRIYCAVGAAEADYQELQRLGYRWNLAVPTSAPEVFLQVKGRLEARLATTLLPEPHPEVQS